MLSKSPNSTAICQLTQSYIFLCCIRKTHVFLSQNVLHTTEITVLIFWKKSESREIASVSYVCCATEWNAKWGVGYGGRSYLPFDRNAEIEHQFWAILRVSSMDRDCTVAVRGSCPQPELSLSPPSSHPCHTRALTWLFCLLTDSGQVTYAFWTCFSASLMGRITPIVNYYYGLLIFIMS